MTTNRRRKQMRDEFWKVMDGAFKIALGVFIIWFVLEGSKHMPPPDPYTDPYSVR
jgi:hypothetical protein